MASRNVSRTADHLTEERPSASAPNGSTPPAQPELRLPPLAISGLVLEKADLLTALRVYVPLAIDIGALGDDRFVLTLLTEPPENGHT